MIFLCFYDLPGSAEAVIRLGGKISRAWALGLMCPWFVCCFGAIWLLASPLILFSSLFLYLSFPILPYLSCPLRIIDLLHAWF